MYFAKRERMILHLASRAVPNEVIPFLVANRLGGVSDSNLEFRARLRAICVGKSPATSLMEWAMISRKPMRVSIPNLMVMMITFLSLKTWNSRKLKNSN